MELHVTYWVPRKYGIDLDTKDVRQAVAGRPEEAAVSRVLDAFEATGEFPPGGPEILAAGLGEYGHYLLCSDEEHELDTEAAEDFAVELARS